MISRKCWEAFFSTFLALTGISAIAFGQEDYSVNPQFFDKTEDTASSDAGLAIASSDCAYADCGGCDGCGAACCTPRCCPQWEAAADFIIMDRIGGKSQTLLRSIGTEDDLLNSNDFHFGFYGGPRVSLIRHGCRGYDLEALYFMIDGWSCSRIVPTSQTFYDYPIEFDWSSRLYNAELNLRWNPLCRVTVLAGFRWAEVREKLNAGYVVDTIFEPVYDIKTDNNLYGFQIGADAILFQIGCLSIDGLLKGGIYGNHAEQTTSYTSQEQPFSISDSTNHTAFIGELGLQAKYQVNDCLTLRAGYVLMWLDGIAVAPAQLDALPGIDTNSTILYHGATAGLEYSF